MIRTREQAQKEDLEGYYQCHCEYCNGDFVASNNDLNTWFFGQPKIENDESAWKCPTCGHVNINKTKELTPCYQSGSTDIKFELSEEETQKVLEFKKEHKHTILNQPGLKHFKHFGDIDQFTYTLIGYGYGFHIKIKCNECGEEKEIC